MVPYDGKEEHLGAALGWVTLVGRRVVLAIPRRRRGEDPPPSSTASVVVVVWRRKLTPTKMEVKRARDEGGGAEEGRKEGREKTEI